MQTLCLDILILHSEHHGDSIVREMFLLNGKPYICFKSLVLKKFITFHLFILSDRYSGFSSETVYIVHMAYYQMPYKWTSRPLHFINSTMDQSETSKAFFAYNESQTNLSTYQHSRHEKISCITGLRICGTLRRNWASILTSGIISVK